MSTGTIIGIVIAVVVILVVIAVLAMMRGRRTHLREQFGPEYDRTVREHPRREAERELAQREKRHSKLDIKELSPTLRDRYSQHWALVQEQFVDQPSPSVEEADRLVTALMAERGYPTEDYDQQVADLSVGHARTLEHYREAHEIKERNARTQVSTEELRAAMVHYRALFDDLLGKAEHRADQR
ncbi:hypothetical protein [Actinokineospora xionganensis]|uniref:Secreted protein n=1 Tax=Actinokineospora xionganensis TaxID=2684470 RepID=A0ABR7L724_9PSEU|nr:hypothetical protein [Actinokineospora xionganensis]MBC6448176.1 hypothetical protein [Actinokineospora xionganensis]